MPFLSPSVEELNPLTSSDEQLQKELKEDFGASMAEVSITKRLAIVPAFSLTVLTVCLQT